MAETSNWNTYYRKVPGTLYKDDYSLLLVLPIVVSVLLPCLQRGKLKENKGLASSDKGGGDRIPVLILLQSSLDSLTLHHTGWYITLHHSRLFLHFRTEDPRHRKATELSQGRRAIL